MKDPRLYLENLFRVAVEAADPMRVIASHLPPRPSGSVTVLGAGKASARMAEAVEAAWGPCEGLIITRYGYARPTQKIEVVEAAHPVPDAAGEAATRTLIERAKAAQGFVLMLISGGGSSLLCAPRDGLSLQDKMDINAQLLASGAPISDMNTVRKHLSAVKGGQLAAHCMPASVLSLIISDVPGDDPAFIASGPTVGDVTTPTEALEILQRYNIQISDRIERVLNQPAQVVPPQHLTTAETRIIAAPSQSLAAAAKAAGDVDVRLLGDALEGEARSLGEAQAKQALETHTKMSAGDRPVLLLSGGECTVTKRGNGTGGPNAEFTLSAGLALAGAQGIHVLACDTDGVDGAAEVAGAYCGPETLSGAGSLTPEKALATNDAHTFFGTVGTQIITGPTLTNVNDFRAILIMPPER